MLNCKKDEGDFSLSNGGPIAQIQLTIQCIRSNQGSGELLFAMPKFSKVSSATLSLNCGFDYSSSPDFASSVSSWAALGAFPADYKSHLTSKPI